MSDPNSLLAQVLRSKYEKGNGDGKHIRLGIDPWFPGAPDFVPRLNPRYYKREKLFSYKPLSTFRSME